MNGSIRSRISLDSNISKTIRNNALISFSVGPNHINKHLHILLGLRIGLNYILLYRNNVKAIFIYVYVITLFPTSKRHLTKSNHSNGWMGCGNPTVPLYGAGTSTTWTRDVVDLGGLKPVPRRCPSKNSNSLVWGRFRNFLIFSKIPGWRKFLIHLRAKRGGMRFLI